MTKNPVSLKQSEASGTSWLHRLRTDLFARAEFTIVGIFILLCFINIGIIAYSLEKLHLEIATAVISILSGVIATNGSVTASATTTSALILSEVEDISRTNSMLVIAISLIVAVIFGYVATRIALAPTRSKLTSQKQFISNIAHELRTPLSIIRANSEIMLLQKSTKPDTASLVESNVEELDRISTIIDNLLTLSTFRQTSTLGFESVNLSEIVRESVTKLTPLTESRELILDTSYDNDLTVWANKNALTQIAMNLIKNALLFTPPKGNIFVSTFASSGFASLEVRDTGVGIEPDEIEKVFEPFYQVEPSRSQNKGSGGLGLAIVSELVKIHNGKITIRSTPHMGTVVKIDFPLEGKKRPAPSKIRDGNEVTLDFSRK